MKMSTVFMLGTISGVVVVGLWRRELRAYAAESSRRIRAKVPDGLRAEELLQGTKERVDEALGAGQIAIRPAATIGKA
jgi:hypothetical protein